MIAVLAFDNIPPDGDLEYFSDGFSIELMELLSKIQNLRVIGRVSAFWFKGKHASYAEIGEKLGVDRLLAGMDAGLDLGIMVPATLAAAGFEPARTVPRARAGQ